MNIFGIGTDIVSVQRFKKSIKNKNFLYRIFNKKEIAKCKQVLSSSNCYAKRFAAKEAFSKALGTGISKPYISLIGETKKTLKKKFKGKRSRVSLSLSDEKKYAVAFVTISL